jgi:hypothetical protein
VTRKFITYFIIFIAQAVQIDAACRGNNAEFFRCFRFVLGYEAVKANACGEALPVVIDHRTESA